MNTLIDVVIGLVTIYTVFSLAVTSLVEAFLAYGKTRAKNLDKAIKDYYSQQMGKKPNETIGKMLMEDPIISTLYENGRQPSYIKRELISNAIVNHLISGQNNPPPGKSHEELFQDAINGLSKCANSTDLFKAYFTASDGSIGGFKKQVEAHFDIAMERSSGWFKRKVQTFTLFVATGVVLLLNLDTVEIIRNLSSNIESRTALVELGINKVNQAEVFAVETNEYSYDEATLSEAIQQADKAQRDLDQAVSHLTEAKIDIGWKSLESVTSEEIFKSFPGWLISILALSLGAPFWFDILQKFVQIRGTGKSISLNKLKQKSGTSSTQAS